MYDSKPFSCRVSRFQGDGATNIIRFIGLQRWWFMKKITLCAIIIAIGLSFCVISEIAVSNADGTDPSHSQFDYSVEVDGDIAKDTVKVPNSKDYPDGLKPVDRVPFVVSENGKKISKYTLKIDYSGTNFIVKTNTLAFVDGYDNEVVVIPQSFSKTVNEEGTQRIQEFTCKAIEAFSTKTVKTLIIQGNPSVSQISVRDDSFLKLVFTGEPVFGTGNLVRFYDGAINIPEVHFLSSNVKLPAKIAAATAVNSSMDVYLESTSSTVIPTTLLYSSSSKFNPTENNCTNLNLHFSANSVVPAELSGTLKKLSRINFIIDVNSPYWNDYLNNGVVANKVAVDELALVHVIGNPSYQITLAANEGGTVKVDDRAAEGQIVVVQATPSEGYYLKELRYSYGETSQTISGSDGYRFTMPAHEVKITAVFEKCIPSIKAEHTVSGSKISIDVDLEGKPTDGKVPAKISIYVRYSGDDGDRFATGSFSIPVYSDSYQVSFETSMTFGSPVSYLVQVFAADGVTCLNQKEVVITG